MEIKGSISWNILPPVLSSLSRPRRDSRFDENDEKARQPTPTAVHPPTKLDGSMSSSDE